MLLALLYHKIGKGKYANPLTILESHFKWIAENYSTVLPGEKLSSGLSVCLTFDDAFFDFYHLVFPLLQKYQLKAVLSIPTAYILDSTSLSSEQRLKEIQTANMDSPLPSPAFCTWEELKTLSQSTHVQLASHSVHHKPLLSSQENVEEELTHSKQTLESKLNLPITTFVYPFGKFDSITHTLTKKHYSHIMRIGNALNTSWTNTQSLLYRINGDQLPHPRYPFSLPLHLKHSAKYILNTLRKK